MKQILLFLMLSTIAIAQTYNVGQTNANVSSALTESLAQPDTNTAHRNLINTKLSKSDSTSGYTTVNDFTVGLATKQNTIPNIADSSKYLEKSDSSIFATQYDLTQAGSGDMLEATYDVNSNNTVDDADSLGGVVASSYATETEAKGFINDSLDAHIVSGTANNQFMHYDLGSGWITRSATQQLDSLFKDGYTSQNITINLDTANVEIPNDGVDKALNNGGEIHLNTADEQLSIHSGTDGEISGEVSIPLIQTYSITFDPKAVCDGTIDALYLFKVDPVSYPEGITIDKWMISFSQNPTTELDADLSRATAIIGQTSEADIDALDTTDGVASEDTDANINGGSVIAAGQYIYIEFVTAYTAANEQIHFQMWYHGEED